MRKQQAILKAAEAKKAAETARKSAKKSSDTAAILNLNDAILLARENQKRIPKTNRKNAAVKTTTHPTVRVSPSHKSNDNHRSQKGKDAAVADKSCKREKYTRCKQCVYFKDDASQCCLPKSCNWERYGKSNDYCWVHTIKKIMGEQKYKKALETARDQKKPAMKMLSERWKDYTKPGNKYNIVKISGPSRKR